MLNFAANLSTMFGEVDFLDRFALARAAGFRAVECQWPYAHGLDAVARRLEENGLELVLFNLLAGDVAAGERGLASLPARQEEFAASVRQGLDWAARLGCKQLNCLVGAPPPGADPIAARTALVANLRQAAVAFKARGVRLLIEPLNAYDVPRFGVHSSADALALFDEVGGDDLWLQYDVYHMQRGEGELAATIARLLPRIAHIQISDNPGRGEPGTGEINFAFLLRAIDALGYAGWIGCEYFPTRPTAESLGWMRALG